MTKPKKLDKFTFTISKSTPLPLILLLSLVILTLILASENERIRKQELTSVYSSPTPLITSNPIPSITITPTPTKKTIKQPVKTSGDNQDSEWGLAVKKDDGSYTMKVGEDSQMATPNEIYQALLAYRQTKGKSGLGWDERLARYASDRAAFICANGNDGHAGFKDFINNQSGYDMLGYAHLGENLGNMKLSGVHLIEWMYSQSPGHDANQLGGWENVGIGVSGTCNVVIFGGAKL